MDKRSLLIQDFNLLYEELVVHVLVSEPYSFRPTREHPDYDPTRIDKPKKIPAIAEARTHFAKHDALLDQLAQNPTPAFTQDGVEAGRSGKPTSKPPMALEALDLHQRISIEVEALYNQYARAARPDMHGVSHQLQAIRSRLLVRDGDDYLLDHDQAAYLVRCLRRWVNQAKTITGYKAPMVVLHVVCPDCGGDLVTESDGREDVRCLGIQSTCSLQPGVPGDWWWCGNVWPKYMWVDLVSYMESRETV